MWKNMNSNQKETLALAGGLVLFITALVVLVTCKPEWLFLWG